MNDVSKTTAPQSTSPLRDKAGMAAYYEIHPRTLENWMAAGEIPYIKRGGKVLFDLDVIREHDRQCCRTRGRGK